MSVRANTPKVAFFVLLPVLLACLAAAIAGLQLFQDGSSYLFEMLVSHSAVRHDRITILLFQAPTILLVKTFSRFGVDPLAGLPWLRTSFNLNYAITPMVALLLSWLVVRNKEEKLFIWAGLVILFVNLVNFSWVSELLISLQLACPLALALLQDPRSKTFWALLVLIGPFIFFLHPLVIPIYLVMAILSAYLSFKIPAFRNPAILGAVLFSVAAFLRGIYSLFVLSNYEVSFLGTDGTRDYLVSTSIENWIFLVIAVEITLLVLFASSILKSQAARITLWLVTLQSLGLLFYAGRIFLQGILLPVFLAIFLGVSALILFQAWSGQNQEDLEKRYFRQIEVLVVSAGALLVSQYVFYERAFPLKTGLALFTALIILLAAGLDRPRDLAPLEKGIRFRLVMALAFVFAGVLFAKSAMWQASVDRLEGTLRRVEGSCAEIDPAQFSWLQTNPYQIINNWALPSLALVIQDEQPRRLLLEPGDCQVFFDTGKVQVDPWTLLEQVYLVPPIQ